MCAVMQTLLVFIVAFYRVAPVHMTGVGIGIYEDFAEDDVFLKTEKNYCEVFLNPMPHELIKTTTTNDIAGGEW